MTNTQPVIDVENLMVAYIGDVAIRDIDLQIKPGTINALIGPNGGGKSTLFKAIMGFVPPTRGKVSIFGESIRNAQKRNVVAYVPQSEEIDWNFPVSVDDVVMMGRYGYMNLLRIPSAEDRHIVDKCLERVGMTSFRKQQIGALSGGQRKRVFLARALAQQGSIMLLDEPFTGVDAKTEDAIIELLKELRDLGDTVVVSTHDLSSVPEFCDQVIMLNEAIKVQGVTERVFTKENITRTFGGVFKGLNQVEKDIVEVVP